MDHGACFVFFWIPLVFKSEIAGSGKSNSKKVYKTGRFLAILSLIVNI
jgi:hypothetical protein